MPPELWAHAMAASVAPVVIISAAALLSLALYNRLAAIVNRMRAVQRERLQMQERLESLSSKEVEHGVVIRLTCILEGLGDQTARISRRGRLIRNSLMCLLATIGLLVVCSLLNGLAVYFTALSPAAAAFFVAGMLMLLLAIVLAALELKAALAPAEFEMNIVSELTATGSIDNAPILGLPARIEMGEAPHPPASGA